MKQVYLSDGVYATISDDPTYPLVLTTGTHDPASAIDVIYLNTFAVNQLRKLLSPK
jgi:hypothetical protein